MSFTGQTIEIPVGQDGLSGTSNPADLAPSQLTMAKNISYWSGVLRRESGALLQNTVQLPAQIQGGYNWHPAGERSIVPLSNGELRLDTGDGSYSRVAASGLNPFDMLPFFTEGGQEAGGKPTILFCALSPNPPRVIVGNSVDATLIPTGAPGQGHPAEWDISGPSLFVMHEGRMWALGTGNDPHRAWYSSTDNHMAYLSGDGGGSISVYPGEADRIVAACSYKGLLICWKRPFGIYAIDTTETDPTGWRVTRISAYIGSRGPGCVAPLDNDIMFMDYVGNLQLLSGITEYGKAGTRNLTESYDLGSYIRDTYTPDRFQFTTMQYSPARREIHITLATRGSDHEDHRLVIDMNVAGRYRFRVVDRDLCGGLWLASDVFGTLRPVVGGADGRIWMLDQLGTMRSGLDWVPDDPAVSVWATGWMDLGTPVRRKLGKFMEVLAEVDTLVTIAIEVWWDGSLKQTIHLDMGAPGARFDHAHFDQDRFVGTQIITRRVRIVGSGRRLQLVGKSLIPGSDFGLARIFLQGDLSDERITR